jgi:hypothetical protein
MLLSDRPRTVDLKDYKGKWVNPGKYQTRSFLRVQPIACQAGSKKNSNNKKYLGWQDEQEKAPVRSLGLQMLLFYLGPH